MVFCRHPEEHEMRRGIHSIENHIKIRYCFNVLWIPRHCVPLNEPSFAGSIQDSTLLGSG
jgi:hypothetical protein